MTPAIVGAQSGGRADAVREQLATRTWQTIAVITPDALASHLGQQLEAAGVEFSDWTTENLDKGITLLKASVARGLEFDAVIVVEPSAIFEQGRSGPRLLYVAMTRAVQQLVLVHSKGVPSLLYAA